MTIVFDGKEFAREKEEGLIRVVRSFRDVGKTPKLVAILVGDNPESEFYLKLKEKKAGQLGIEFEFRKFSANNPHEITDFIKEKNDDSEVNGIIVELPLPEKLNQFDLLDKISPIKDVDCLTNENQKLLKQGKPKFIPPTVGAVGEILKEAVCLRDLECVEGLATVVVGSEGTVGKGIINYLRNFGSLSNLRGIDKETKDLALVTKEADVLISATGVGHLIQKKMVKPGAVVIDVGIEKQPDGGLKGDVDFEEVKEVVSFITPVPGGVGPVTVVCLMENLLESVYHIKYG